MKKDKKEEDRQWEIMTDFTINMLSLVISLGAFALIVLLFMWITKVFV
jgi:hypothetical protein